MKNKPNTITWTFCAPLAWLLILLLAYPAQAKRVTLEWDYTEEEQAKITGFKLYRTTQVDAEGAPDFQHAEAVVAKIAPDQRRHITEDLAPSTLYYWAITAHDEENESGLSNTVQYQTPDKWQPGMEVLQIPPPSHP